LSADDRAAIIDEIEENSASCRRYYVLTVLASVIAAVGLLTNSPATIIGGRRVYLSELPPASADETGAFGVVWPHSRDTGLTGAGVSGCHRRAVGFSSGLAITQVSLAAAFRPSGIGAVARAARASLWLG
jgi:hypothetical protein